jgi:hypothetical protein
MINNTNIAAVPSNPDIVQEHQPLLEKSRFNMVRRVVPRRLSVVAPSSSTMAAPFQVHHKAVRFSFQVATVATFEKVDQKEAEDVWYSAEENKVLADDCLKSIMAVREAYWNNQDLDDSEHTDLGLERHVSLEQDLVQRAAVKAHACRILAHRRGAVVRSNAAA